MAATTRTSWLLLGTALGLGGIASLAPLFADLEHLSSDIPESSEAAPALTLEEIVAAAPEAEKVGRHVGNAVPLTVEMTVRNGDTMMQVLRNSGISQSQAHDIIASVRPVYNPRKLVSGNNLTVQFSKDIDSKRSPAVKAVVLPLTSTSSIEVGRTADNSFTAKQVDIPVTSKLTHAGGIIESSLYQTVVDDGLPPALVGELIKAYSYDVDFQREIKQGNSMNVLFERLHAKETGQEVGHGNVLCAELELSGRTLKIYRYVSKDGSVDYYNAKGESVRKALLRTPINGAKITSRFGLRSHPILGYTKMHRGVDFGAPTGTPIYAAGDGKVEFVGRKGGYGNYVRIKHNGQYSSAYAHTSRFAAGMKVGKKVKQGDVIAYVGSTGASTGPHLHYEILSGGAQVNPSNVKFKTGNVLAGKELASFQQVVVQAEKQLAAAKRNSNTLAMADDGKTVR